MGFQNSQAKLKRVLRSNPSAFLRKVFHEVNPGEKFFDNWHLDAMAYHLDGCRTNTRKRVLITVPPRSLKSIAASVAFPAFLLGHDPRKHLLCISYGNELALKHSSDFRTVVNSQWYRQLFPHMIAARDVEDFL